MTFRPLLSRPKAKPLLLGFATMIVAYAASTVLLNAIFSTPAHDPDFDARDIALSFVAPCTFLLSGFVAGFAARQSPLMYGAILGVIVTSPFVIIPLVFILIPTYLVQHHPFEGYFDDFSIVKLLEFALWSAFVCALGAIFGAFISGRRKAP